MNDMSEVAALNKISRNAIESSPANGTNNDTPNLDANPNLAQASALDRNGDLNVSMNNISEVATLNNTSPKAIESPPMNGTNNDTPTLDTNSNLAQASASDTNDDLNVNMSNMSEVATLNNVSPNAIESSPVNGTNNGTPTLDTNSNLAQASASDSNKSAPIKTFSPEDVVIFIEKIYAELDLRDVSFILGKRINRRSRWAKMVLLFRKRMSVLYFAFQVLHEFALEEFFTHVQICRRNVFSVMAGHCFAIIEHCPNIYIAFIYTCCFVYVVALYFKYRGEFQFEELVTVSVNEIYEYQIKDKFEKLGGLDALRNYMQATNVVELVDFMRLIYTNPNISKTNIEFFPGMRKFGIENSFCHEEFVVRMDLIVTFTEQLFPGEMTFNSVSRQQILWAFNKLEAEIISYKGLDENRLRRLKEKREQDLRKHEQFIKDLTDTLERTHGKPPPPYPQEKKQVPVKKHNKRLKKTGLK